MVNEESSADSGAGVDFNAGQKTIDMGDETSKKLKSMTPEKMSQAMEPQGMESWIAEYYLQHTPCRRVFGKYRSNVFPQSSEQDGLPFTIYILYPD